MLNLDQTDPTFIDDLEQSKNTVWIVARWLSDRGNYISIPPTAVRPSAKQRLDYSDNGDLFIMRRKRRAWDRVEVKSRNLVFSSAADFPFKTIIVDVTHSYDNAKIKPLMYVLTNSAHTYCAIVKCTTFPQWKITRRYDGHAGRERSFYECPIKLVKFYKM